MIIDVQKFVTTEEKYWQELETMLGKLQADPGYQMSLVELQKFHDLYRRTSADLAKISTFASEKEIRAFLESLVARAYSEIHEVREKSYRFKPLQWFFHTFPQTFRRQARYFALSVAITMIGSLFGGFAIAMDPDAKEIVMPFSHLHGDPSQRVHEEEKSTIDRLQGFKTTFASDLMTHNIKVAILTLAMGMTWGIGTIILLFYNGVILGAVVIDYFLAGETKFLLGWLMPHGVIEIPAILIGGQVGLLLAVALIGHGKRMSLRTRLREILPDAVTLTFGLALLLVWAGFIESFLSQYHEPTIPYFVKIAFGILELGLLALLLGRSGKKAEIKNEPLQN